MKRCWIRASILRIGLIALLAGLAPLIIFVPECQANEPPKVKISASPQIVPPFGMSTITVIANDPDGDKLRYTWSARKGQVPSGEIPDSVIIYIAPNTPGYDVVMVQVNDGYNLPQEAAVAIEVSQPPSEPGIPPPPPPLLSGRIAFPLFDDKRNTYDIYIANPDGSGRKLLREQASQPDIDIRGTKMAFRSWQSDGRGIWIKNLSTGEEKRLTEYYSLEDRWPNWSPDSRILLYFSRSDGDRVPRLWQVGEEGSDERKLRCAEGDVFGETPEWMPDGRIVYKRCSLKGDCYGIHISNIDGSNLLSLSGEPYDISPAPSPDGSRIAFMSMRDGNWEIYIVNSDGTGLRRLTSNSANDGLPTWSPGGGSIAFVSNRDGPWAIWVMNPDGSNQRKLFDLGGNIDGYPVRDWFAAGGWVEERISWGP
ncbi:MAG: TolB family protein [Anaerolineae bacterium]